jgi:transcriptional regulator with XRE-family HTH domain
VSETDRNFTDPDESIGATLARLRRASGLSGAEAGRRAGMSQAKVSRIETGAVTPAPDDVGQLARALGVDEQLAGQLMSRTVIAQRRPTDWSPSPIGLASGQRVIAQREAQVNIIRAFEPIVIHGLLQTGEYARALLSVFRMQETVAPTQARSPAASVAEALAERIGRQEILTDSRRSFVFVMMETVFDNNFCPAEDMLGQIRRLWEISQQYDNVSIRIVPLSAKPKIPALHGFELFDDELVAIDTFNTTLTSTGEPDLRLYRHVFDSFEAAATAEIEPIIAKYQNHYARQLSSPHNA